MEIYLWMIEISLNYLFLLFCWAWWLLPPDPRGFGLALGAVIVHPVLVYETGYKKHYRVGRKEYFYFVYLIPGILSVTGFLIGLFVKHIQH